MAFAKSANTAANTSSSDAWKAAGFINLYLPSKAAKEKKLGSIPLRTNRAAEKELCTWLESNAANVAALASDLIVEFNSIDPSNQDQFDLSFSVDPVDPAEEKTGYINFYLPSKDGARRKLGFIALKESDATLAPMLNWLLANADGINEVKSKLIVKYQSSTSTAHGFALRKAA